MISISQIQQFYLVDGLCIFLSMNASIENEKLKVIASQKGAELQSIRQMAQNMEYLWQGDPKHWGRRAPVLFPIVGKLKEDIYTFEGKEYRLGQHGFARDQTFELVERSAHHLMYHLKANDETRKSYPFDFELSITYTLQNNRLTVSYMVENPADEDLFFSIGAHPAFNCPLRSGEKRSDYTLSFEENESIERQLIEEGIRVGKRVSVLEDANELAITDHLFDRDALIFDNLRSSQLSLCIGAEPIVTVIFDEFDYLGIWSKSAESPFICIEPWLGIADHQTHSGDLKRKEGIIELKAKEVFTAQYHLIFGGA